MNRIKKKSTGSLSVDQLHILAKCTHTHTQTNTEIGTTQFLHFLKNWRQNLELIRVWQPGTLLWQLFPSLKSHVY